MRKIALILVLVALSQLTACVAHRHYSDTQTRSSSRYQQPAPVQYPSQYQDQYPDQTPQRIQQTHEPYRTHYQVNDQQSQSELVQIIDIRQIREVSHSNGGGAVIGAIIGGIIGNQLGRNEGHASSRGYGHGRGRDHRGNYSSDDGRGAATVGGAIIGGVIGNEVDRSSSEQRVRTEITLRFANGQTQTVVQNNSGNFRPGDWVRIGLQAGRWVIY